jgi:hypothetical protein
MGTDLFIEHGCRFRQDGDAGQLHHLLRLKRRLEVLERAGKTGQSVRLTVNDAGGPREQVYTHADLKLAVARLAEVYPVCESCPANLKKAFGIRGTVGCHAYVGRPLDDFAERILYETLVENARDERADTEQSNLVRALVTSTPADGRRWQASAARSRPVAPEGWGAREVTVRLDVGTFGVSVHALLELLFMFPRFPLRAIEDVLSFFRSFFAVVGGYVSTPDGKLDQQRNERFWRQSQALNELNLYIQLLKHALRLKQGVLVLSA